MTRIVSFLSLLAGTGLLFFLTGCGGNSSPAPAPAPSENRVQQNLAEKTGLGNPKEEEAQKDRKPKRKKKRPAPKPEETSVDEYLPEELRVPEVTLPVESSQWTESEFTYIRTAQPTLFDAAIAELSKRLANPASAEEAARILARFVQSVVPGALAQEQKLLAEEEKMKALQERSEENARDEQDGRRGRRDEVLNTKPVELIFYQLTQNQVRTAMEALAGSTSEAAMKHMAAFLAGTITTDENRVGLDAAMAAYAQKATDEKIAADEETLLLQFLLMPVAAVSTAANYADVDAPVIPEEELDENGNPIRRENSGNSGNNTRGNHPPILIAPGKRVQFRFLGGSGNSTAFTHLDVQKQVLTRFCPASSPLFRARIARELTGQDVLQAADTVEKQAFLLNDVLEKFLMKKDFANALAHIVIFQQPDLDEKYRTVLEDNLCMSHSLLMQHHFGLMDPKEIQDYRAAQNAKRERIDADAEAQRDAEKSAAQTNTTKAPVSLLSRKAQMENSNLNGNQNRNGNQSPSRQFPPMVELLMNPTECTALEQEVWTPGMRSLLLDRITTTLGAQVESGLANIPEPGTRSNFRFPNIEKTGLQAIQMYLTIPCNETRYQLYLLLDQGWMLGPEAFKMALFDRLETEPGFLMVVKSLDRRVKPADDNQKKKQQANRKRPTKVKTPSRGALMREKRQEVGAAWMDQSYNLVCQWCKKFSQAAKNRQELQSVERIVDKNVPKPEEPTIPSELRQQFPLPQGSEVLAYYTAEDPEMSQVSTSGRLKITYFEVRCTALLPRLVSTFKSKNSRLLERGILTKANGQNVIANAHWLERWEINDETGKRESLDILIAPAVQPTDQNRNVASENGSQAASRGPKDYIVHVLIMEMDDLAGDHQSRLKADEEDENVEFSDDGDSEEDSEEGSEDENDSSADEESAYSDDENE